MSKLWRIISEERYQYLTKKRKAEEEEQKVESKSQASLVPVNPNVAKQEYTREEKLQLREEQILQFVQPERRSQARELISLLKNTKKFKLLSNGYVKVSEQKLKNSIVGLTLDLVVNSWTYDRKPQEADVLIDLIESANVPSNLLSAGFKAYADRHSSWIRRKLKR